MKKIVGGALLAALVLVLASPVPSFADGHGHWGFHGTFVIGPGWGWGPWWGAPYYPYPYYSAPPAVVQQPPVYVDPAPTAQQANYWFYCQNPQGYYPYIQQCPAGWMRVVPPSTPPHP